MGKIEKYNCSGSYNNMKGMVIMRTGLIYKFTNKLNNKIYIGQTTQTLEQRINKHLQQLNDETYFHRALKKYGINNFNIEIIEQNIPLSELDNREIYWIKYYDSYYTSNKGYNLTKGGQWGNSSQLICGSAENEIKDLIKNSELTFKQIGDLFGVSLSCISDINRGKTFYEENIIYPIRNTSQHTKLTNELVNQIIDYLKDSDLSIIDIGLTLGISNFTIGEINRGKNSWCPQNINYPIRKSIQKNTYQNKINQNQVQEICYKLIFTSNTIEEIAKQYNLGKNTIGDISRGITWKEITHQFELPIRKNKIKNQQLYQKIYGIV